MNQCVNCSKETSNPRFCSRSCGVSYNNRIKPKRIKRMRTCKFCKNQFHSIHSYNQKYCNKQCLQNHRGYNIQTDGFGEGHYHNNSIRKYLIKKQGNNCMICGQSGNDWNGKPITLIVDHIDGKSNNNKLDNLRIVCPNCDCQLPTYKAKNKGNSSRKYYIVQK